MLDVEDSIEYATRLQRAAAYRFIGNHAPELAEVAYSTTVHGTAAHDQVHITILIHAEYEATTARLLGDIFTGAGRSRALDAERFRCYIAPRKTRIFEIRFYIEREQ